MKLRFIRQAVSKKKGTVYIPTATDRIESRVADAVCLIIMAGMGWWWTFGLWFFQTSVCEVIFEGYDLYAKQQAAREGHTSQP